ncbi:hypothetical protein HYDPIDRAFT_164873 [Hydnomerulius pinastri MD-312]|nr:hypothetical protein HYDPIDRAFT_164873 [Hydnomerulius pinastri MD-312]
MSPVLFPYALASVCYSWRSTLASVPKYWTRVVIAVSDPPTPLSHIQRFFSWSRSLPLHVIIARRAGTYGDCDCTEKQKVAKIIPLVTPHILRCMSVRISVRYSSSLPSLRVDFQGRAAPLLKTLKLKCRKDDASGGSIGCSPIFSKLFAPHLTQLQLDGRSFEGMCLPPVAWLSELRGLKTLIVSRFHRTSQSDGLDLYGLLSAIESCSGLISLALKDLAFRRTRPWTFQSIISNVRYVSLESLDGDAFSEIIKAADIVPERITVTRCFVTALCPSLIADYVCFDTMDADQNLMYPLWRWSGKSMSVFNCPTFDNEFLDHLSDGGSDDVNFPCPQLREIHLSGCKSFSSRTFREMVQRRAAVSRKEFSGNPSAIIEHDFDILAPITLVSVDGGPPLTPRDRAWLQGNLAHFHWSTEPSGDGLEEEESSHPKPVQAFLGGVGIALSVHSLLVFNGSVLGVSGFIHCSVQGNKEAATAVLGMILGGVASGFLGGPGTIATTIDYPKVILSGFLVGIGTKVISIALTSKPRAATVAAAKAPIKSSLPQKLQTTRTFEGNMKSIAAALILLASAVSGYQPLIMNTPAATYQCEPTLLTWSGGKASYLIAGTVAIPGVFIVQGETGHSYNWIVGVSGGISKTVEGTPIAIRVEDSTNTTAVSGTFTVGISGYVAQQLYPTTSQHSLRIYLMGLPRGTLFAVKLNSRMKRPTAIIAARV